MGYSYPESAEEAFVNLNGTKVENKVIKIDFPGRKMPVSRLIVKNLPTVKRRMRERKIDGQTDRHKERRTDRERKEHTVSVRLGVARLSFDS